MAQNLSIYFTKDEMREIIILRHIRNFTPYEISQKIGISTDFIHKVLEMYEPDDVKELD